MEFVGFNTQLDTDKTDMVVRFTINHYKNVKPNHEDVYKPKSAQHVIIYIQIIPHRHQTGTASTRHIGRWSSFM
jgi:hypothetical protein